MVDRIPLRATARQAPAAVVGLPPVSRPDQPVSVHAWIVDSKGQDVEVAGEAVAWNARTVSVHYFDEHGREGWVSVWASAVRRRAT